MEANRKFRYDQLIPDDDVRRNEDKRTQDQTRKPVEDTKRKIREAFAKSERIKASLRS